MQQLLWAAGLAGLATFLARKRGHRSNDLAGPGDSDDLTDEEIKEMMRKEEEEDPLDRPPTPEEEREDWIFFNDLDFNEKRYWPVLDAPTNDVPDSLKKSIAEHYIRKLRKMQPSARRDAIIGRVRLRLDEIERRLKRRW